MKITPVNHKIIIKKVKREEKKGALILLTQEEGYEPFFEIVTLTLDYSGELKPGDKVYIDRYSNHAIEGYEDLYVVREENIIGVFHE